VGFTDATRSTLAWVAPTAASKYIVRNGELTSRPRLVDEYIASWRGWFASLSGLVGKGWASCRSWELKDTLQAFLDGVLRALMLTPLFCIIAVFLCVRDLCVSYIALYTIVGTIVTTLGLMHVFEIGLGPIESLALAVIIGVSVDYLIHLAFAYKNSLMQQRYYKSRAAMLARTGSITSAALTTLCSVMPLLGSKLMPLRQFGAIFTLVAFISYVFAIGLFNTFLMAAGPKVTRETSAPEEEETAAPSEPGLVRAPSHGQQLVRDDASIQAAQLDQSFDVGVRDTNQRRPGSEDPMFYC